MRSRAPAPQRHLPFGRLSPASARPRRRRGPAREGVAREALRRRQFERLMDRLRADALRIADRFSLRYRALLIERPTARSHYGICYRDGTIKIRLNHAVYMRPLRYSSLVNTVCHELAHLRYFDHGDGFKRFYAQILGWARLHRIYRPHGRAAEQVALNLEEAGDCRVDAAQTRAWLKVMRGRLAHLQEGSV